MSHGIGQILSHRHERRLKTVSLGRPHGKLGRTRDWINIGITGIDLTFLADGPAASVLGVSWFWDSVRFDASLCPGSARNALIRLDRAVRCTRYINQIHSLSLMRLKVEFFLFSCLISPRTVPR